MSIGSIAVIGCGVMGLGIVEAAAKAGIPVRAIKATPGDTSKASKQLAATFAKAVAKGKISQADADAAVARVEFSTDLDQVSDVDLVIESALEEFETKASLLANLESRMTQGAILATNTSSLRLEALGEGLRRPEQFLGLHFFNPVSMMALVEIGITERAAPGVIQAARSFCTEIGKTSVDVASAPGYVVNRLLVPYILHAIETLEAGIASAEAIDSAMKLGCGHPMGPLALADLIGLDVVFAMARTLQAELGDSRYRAPSLLRKLVLAGQLGRKTKLGIYDYTGESPRMNPTLSLRPRRLVAEAAE